MPDARRIRFRVGVNLGDIIVEGSGVYGDDVHDRPHSREDSHAHQMPLKVGLTGRLLTRVVSLVLIALAVLRH